MTRPLFCFCAAFALGCIASQYFLAPTLWLPAAGIVLVLLPCVLIFVVGFRFFIAGITEGAVKG